MRLFIAIDIPEDLKKEIAALRADIPGAHWVAVERLHLTLAFLGEVDETVVEVLNSELSRIQWPPFDLCLSGSGCFPSRSRPRVLWIGLKPEPRLNELASQVRTAVFDCGVPLDAHRFSPHVTLAKLKQSPSRNLNQYIDLIKKLIFKPFTVHEFILYYSELHPQSTKHIPLRKYKPTCQQPADR